ncbi:MAG TPA: DUF3084 domain-containing protein [Leptolyngbyaceae cyanobacterium M33_DOE_097]|uniref:DUF3084 domain-containing protein n=1 Tax=Oscillatoriales cyanobacterium SpSt-418 TaxID=2282169 RepID=A0A7C3PEP6_9CYAN|nr:DUF3084 domain-containing protein [Leptolyngbyaceae cyanobacterium M33_DOE_097]
MTTATAILVLAILLLGGVIATIGDRLGTKIGKARMSLFNLRPRKTATLVTILTGTIISAVTFGLLFSLSEELRRGVFEYEKTQKRFRQARRELEETSLQLQNAQRQKTQIETELAKTRQDGALAKKQLTQTTSNLKKTQAQLSENEKQLAEKENRLLASDRSLRQSLAEQARARAAANRVVSELNQTRSQLANVSKQATSLRTEINTLEQEKEQLIAQKQDEINNREIAIQEREARLKELQARLGGLEEEQSKLENLVQALQKDAESLAQKNIDLRSKSFAIQRGQVLGSAVVRVLQPSAAKQAIDRLLQEANQQASRLLRLSNDTKIDQTQRILPTRSEVNQLIQQIGDGREYVLRVTSIANYLEGETVPVIVRIEAVQNRQVFKAGDVLASITVDPKSQTMDSIRQRFDQLLLAAGFRAQLLGVLNESVDIGSIQNLSRFLEQLQQTDEPLQIRAIAAAPIYAAGPLKIEFVAERNGEVLFRSN